MLDDSRMVDTRGNILDIISKDYVDCIIIVQRIS